MAAQPQFDQLLKEWKLAEQQARDAEILLYRAYAAFTAGKGPGPSEQMKQEASALRTRARLAYQAAMAAVDRVLDEADRRSRGF